MNVQSVATLATLECIDELCLFVSSLRQHHPRILIVVGASSALIEKVLSSATAAAGRDGDSHEHLLRAMAVDSNIMWIPCLDQFGKIERSEMEQSVGVWFPTRHADFMMEKANVMQLIFERRLASNVMFLDCDIVTLAPLPKIPSGCILAVSPHRIASNDEALWGRYNGGLVWTSDPRLLFEWRRATHNSRFHDQASLEDVVSVCRGTAGAQNTVVAELGPEVNYGYWRMFQTELRSQTSLAEDGVMMEASKFRVERGKPIHYSSNIAAGSAPSGVPLQSVHTHFFLQKPPPSMAMFNGILRRWIKTSGKDVYRGLVGALL